MKKKRFAGMGILMLFCICMLWGKTVLADPLATEEQVAVHLTVQEEKEAEQNGKSAKQSRDVPTITRTTADFISTVRLRALSICRLTPSITAIRP